MVTMDEARVALVELRAARRRALSEYWAALQDDDPARASLWTREAALLLVRITVLVGGLGGEAEGPLPGVG